jgi:hypothetical protein
VNQRLAGILKLREEELKGVKEKSAPKNFLFSLLGAIALGYVGVGYEPVGDLQLIFTTNLIFAQLFPQ